MADRAIARRLLRRSAELYDGPDSGLRDGAPAAAWGLFASGARWMQRALEHIRGQPLAGPRFSLNVLGLLKYTPASLGALICLSVAWWLEQWWWALMAIPVFYAIEVQMVFLFPVALDGSPQPFRAAWSWTRRAGGTIVAMMIVLPLVAVMLFGGFFGRGFVRCWCLGCLAVCLWYEELRIQAVRQDAHAGI